MAWGDYDNDGDLDILLTGRQRRPHAISRVYRNTGGTFTDIGAGLTGVTHSSVAWGDYDNDGDLDILLTGRLQPRLAPHRAGVPKQRRHVQRPQRGTHGRAFSSVAWGDYDNDGDLDILLTGQLNSGDLISRLYQNTERHVQRHQRGTHWRDLMAR